MTIIKVTEARAKLYRLIDQTAKEHKPFIISGKRNNAILVSEEDWNSIQETLHLLSVPGMRESLIDGMKIPVEECTEDIEW